VHSSLSSSRLRFQRSPWLSFTIETLKEEPTIILSRLSTEKERNFGQQKNGAHENCIDRACGSLWASCGYRACLSSPTSSQLSSMPTKINTNYS
jgi:hypothetical protein